MSDVDARVKWVLQGAAAWPDVVLEPGRLRGFIEGQDWGARPGLDARYSADAFLACACAIGNERAVAAFERHFVPGAEPAARRVLRDEAAVQECMQRVRERLFVWRDEAPPKIASYQATGPLRAWLRVVTAREALQMVRGKPRTETWEAIASGQSGPDPESGFMKVRYRDAFREAFQEALQLLEPKERMLLALHFVDGVPIAKIAQLESTHRGTAARRIQRIRVRLLKETRRRMMGELQVSRAQADSVVRMCLSQANVTLGILKAAVAEDPESDT